MLGQRLWRRPNIDVNISCSLGEKGDIYSSEWPDSAENQWPATYHYYTDLIFTVLKCQTVQIWL